MSRERKAWLGPGIAVAFFAVALWAIHRELALIHYRDLVAAVERLSFRRVGAAIGFTAASFLLLTGYDALGLRFIGAALPWRRTAFASFVGYSFSQALGFPLLTGAPVRFRLYSGWGLSATEIGQLVALYSLAFWVGFLCTGGIAFVLEPLDVPSLLHLPLTSVRPAGIALLAITAAYLIFTARSRTLRIRSWELPLPTPRLALMHVGIGILDWAFAAGVLWVLLPQGADFTFATFLTLFLLAQFAGLISHVPGGLGVFEAVILTSMPGSVPQSEVLASLLVYRAVYYLFPLVIASLSLGAWELGRTDGEIRKAATSMGRGISAVLPYGLAITTFVGGMILLLSGATPAQAGRLRWLDRLLPLPVIEASHFLGSIAGAGLIILAWGLQQRLDAAYHLSILLLGAGAMFSLGKGLDYEEASILTLMLIALVASRREFYRKASLLNERFTPRWGAAVTVALLATGGLGLFAFKHVAYSGELWWRFALNGDAPRFLRAFVGASVVTLGFVGLRLLRPSPPEPGTPAPAEIDRAFVIARGSEYSYSSLVALGDKSILFGNADSFLMYAVEGASWVSLGDPVGGSENDRVELAWEFREMAHQHGDRAVFYQIRPDSLPLYVDMGLSLLKLGEEGRVPLSDFSLEGGARSGLRQTLRRTEREGASFEMLEPGAFGGLMPELRAVSDAWLEGKSTREKRFSLGWFDESYLDRFHLATVRRDGRLIAFANVLLAGTTEISPDLMRYLPEGSPAGVMEYLFIHLMLWGREQGFAWCDLGMAPLAGLDAKPLSPLWTRLGAALYRHGEHFYNFQGLRGYKEKFHPIWEPRYLAAPGGLILPRILTNVATLISGGLRGVVSR